MKSTYTTAIALLGAASASANLIPGDLQVTNFLSRLDTKGHTQIASFTLSGNATKNAVVCRGNDPVGGYENYANKNIMQPCGSSPFKFSAEQYEGGYLLNIWEQFPEPEGEGYFSPGRGGWVRVETTCTKGPNGAKCLQKDGFVGEIYLSEQ